MSRGMILVDNSLELILVGIAVVLILVGGSFAYNTWSNKNEDKNAQHLLDSILGKYDLLEDGQNNSFIFQGFKGGEKWYLVGWSLSDPSRPEKCFFTSCLCSCRGGALAKNCQDSGFCRALSVNSLDISTSITVNQKSLSGGMTVSSRVESFSCIPLSRQVLPLTFRKGSDSLYIYGDSASRGQDVYNNCAR